MNEHSKQFDRFKRLYNEGKLTEAGLDKAVALGLITAAEKREIMESNED